MKFRLLQEAAIFTFLAGALGGLSGAWADDLNAPEYFGDPNSLVVFWQEANPGAGDLVQSGFDFFDQHYDLTDFDDGAGPGQPNLEIIQEAEGINYRFFQPDFVDLLPLKLMRIQVTYSGPAQPIISILGVDPDAEVIVTGPVGGVLPGEIEPSNPDAAFYYYEDYELAPNPDYEYVNLFLPTAGILHQVVIDTISIPEPATGVLAGIGLLLLVTTRFRRADRC